MSVNGQTQVDLYTIPFSRASLDVSVLDDNKLSLVYDVKVSNETLTLTDVSAIWNYSPGVDVNSTNLVRHIFIGVGGKRYLYLGFNE